MESFNSGGSTCPVLCGLLCGGKVRDSCHCFKVVMQIQFRSQPTLTVYSNFLSSQKRVSKGILKTVHDLVGRNSLECDLKFCEGCREIALVSFSRTSIQFQRLWQEALFSRQTILHHLEGRPGDPVALKREETFRQRETASSGGLPSLIRRERKPNFIVINCDPWGTSHGWSSSTQSH